MKGKENGIRNGTIWLGVFITLFLLAEVVLRLLGYIPGVITNHNYVAEGVNDSTLYGDENGISHYAKRDYREGAQINEQGFIGDYNYDIQAIDSLRRLNRKIIMFIGDSYTEGCCSDSIEESFYGLINANPEYEVLNFGVAGTDPLQYKLVAIKYVPLLKPDLVITFVYGGNDVMTYDRSPKPFIPACYVVKDGPWFNSEVPTGFGFTNSCFQSFEEALEFNNANYTLLGKDRNLMEKLMGKSVILSRIYLGLEIFFKKRITMEVNDQQPPFTNNNLLAIDSIAKNEDVQNLFVLIPSPHDVRKRVDLKSKYEFLFLDLNWQFPENLNRSDYDGRANENHFNNAGHKKMANFLTTLIAVSPNN